MGIKEKQFTPKEKMKKYFLELLVDETSEDINEINEEKEFIENGKPLHELLEMLEEGLIDCLFDRSDQEIIEEGFKNNLNLKNNFLKNKNKNKNKRKLILTNKNSNEE